MLKTYDSRYSGMSEHFEEAEALDVENWKLLILCTTLATKARTDELYPIDPTSYLEYQSVIRGYFSFHAFNRDFPLLMEHSYQSMPEAGSDRILGATTHAHV